MDAVVRHWESLVAGATGWVNSDEDEAGQTTEGRTIRGRGDGKSRVEEVQALLKVQAEFLNSEDRMLASTNPVWIQTTFEILLGLFVWVGLRTNVQKTVGMVYQSCRAVRVRADEAYRCWMTGEGQS